MNAHTAATMAGSALAEVHRPETRLPTLLERSIVKRTTESEYAGYPRKRPNRWTSTISTKIKPRPRPAKYMAQASARDGATRWPWVGRGRRQYATSGKTKITPVAPAVTVS